MKEPQGELQSLIAHFLDADQRGAAVDREAILAEHPNLAESLRDFFEQHDRLRGRSATGTGSVDPAIAVASESFGFAGVMDWENSNE